MWRLYGFFKGECVFLDIETSGMDKFDDITVIGLFDGLETKTMIKGINLNFYELKKELRKYRLIITFNGSTFDIPFIRKRYPDLLPNVPNFDLRVACQRVGLTGGLKEIEKMAQEVLELAKDYLRRKGTGQAISACPVPFLWGAELIMTLYANDFSSSGCSPPQGEGRELWRS